MKSVLFFSSGKTGWCLNSGWVSCHINMIRRRREEFMNSRFSEEKPAWMEGSFLYIDVHICSAWLTFTRLKERTEYPFFSLRCSALNSGGSLCGCEGRSGLRTNVSVFRAAFRCSFVYFQRASVVMRWHLSDQCQVLKQEQRNGILIKLGRAPCCEYK